jgi:hypothetical protein
MMKKSLSLFIAIALAAGAVSASDITQKVGHKTLLKTSRSAHCSTPSGRISRECAGAPATQAPRVRHF